MNARFTSETTKDMTTQKNSKRTPAIIIGIALLLMAVVAAYSAPVISKAFVSGNPALTALNVSGHFSKYMAAVIGWLMILVLDLLVSLGVYNYYKKEQPNMAFGSGLLRLVYSMFLGVAIFQLLRVSVSSPAIVIYHSIQAFNSIWGWGLIVFGLHLIALGLLFKNEGGKQWLTILIKTFLIIAGLGYLILNAGILFSPHPLAFTALIQPVFLMPMILGEVFFALWMLIRGGKKS